MDTRSSGFRSLAELQAWCQRAPAGTRLDARQVAEILADVAAESPSERDGDHMQVLAHPVAPTWRERLWTVPAETRIGVCELAEAVGRGKGWVYERTRSSADDPIPHRKLDGTLIFTAGEVRAWIRSREEEIVGGPMESTRVERGVLHAV